MSKNARWQLRVVVLIAALGACGGKTSQDPMIGDGGGGTGGSAPNDTGSGGSASSDLGVDSAPDTAAGGAGGDGAAPTPPGDAGPDVAGDPSCTGYCQAVVAVGCANDKNCLEDCASAILAVQAQCRARWRGVLACLATLPPAQFMCNEPSGRAVPRPGSCQDAYQTYVSCGAP